MMFPVDLFDETGGLIETAGPAWRCFACGDIIDQLISINRNQIQNESVAPHKKRVRHRIAVGV
jgi:hypothetical protein